MTDQNNKMDPMFLPGVERKQQPSAWTDSIRLMEAAGAEYPQSWHMFPFRPEVTRHLANFTQEVMRERSPLSPGLRELIAAYTSARNHCPF